jgi:hypothetical protein
MIDLLSASRSSFAPKSYHRIRLSRGFRSDLEWWRSFVSVWNGVGFFPSASRPSVCFSSDASGSWGCAAHWGNHWFQLKWDGPSRALPIAVKELIPIILAAAVWGPRWRGETVKCLCDNQAVVASVSSRSSQNPNTMHLLRALFFIEARFGCSVCCSHIPGVLNTTADALSRNNLMSFRLQVPGADPDPFPLPTPCVEALFRSDLDWLSQEWRERFNSIFDTASPSPPSAPTPQE